VLTHTHTHIHAHTYANAHAGATFAAAATSGHLLRLFSVSGLQTTILSLPGSVVAMTAQVRVCVRARVRVQECTCACMCACMLVCACRNRCLCLRYQTFESTCFAAPPPCLAAHIPWSWSVRRLTVCGPKSQGRKGGGLSFSLILPSI
jgi:hypothetical protein